jgi:hypothetical protein
MGVSVQFTVDVANDASYRLPFEQPSVRTSQVHAIATCRGVTMALFVKKKSEDLKEKKLRCSFCGKSKDAVAKLISGPAAYICDECVELCNKILAEEAAPRS